LTGRLEVASLSRQADSHFTQRNEEVGMAFGWRARIGMILPADNAVLEPEAYRLGIPGVAFHTVRLDTWERDQMPAAGVRLSAAFGELGVDAVGYACAETSFIGGQDANTVICAGVEEAIGRPAVTATGAMVEALSALGVGSVAVAAPYRQSSADALQEYLERSGGVTVVSVATEDFSMRSADDREWFETNLQPPSTAYRLARAADNPDAEAIVVAATNLRSLEILRPLEADLGKPVISSNSALLWALLRRCRVSESRDDLGRLWQTDRPQEVA
jgi:maleate isomerase